MTTDAEPGAAVATSGGSLNATPEPRADADRGKRSPVRLAAAGLSGCTTLCFAAGAALMLLLGVVQGKWLMTAAMVAMFALPAALFGFLAWRWGRRLPPSSGTANPA